MSEHTLQLRPSLPDGGVEVRLEVIAGPHRGLAWSFDRPQTLTLGRLAPAQLRLPNEPAASREHLQLNISVGGVELNDLDSRNGTSINGVHVRSATLNHQDVIAVGETSIRFEIETQDRINVDNFQTNRHSAAATTPAEATRLHPFAQPVASSPRVVQRKIIQPPTIDSQPGLSDGIDATMGPNDSSRFVGSYELVKLLGQGGMATVHLGRHRRSGELVAVKLIRGDLPINVKQTQMFLRESSVLTRLDHPRIVRAIEFGMEGTTPYLVMEHIETIDLLAMLERQSEAQKIKIATWTVSCILQAVHYAHEQGFVHRDIKPGNVLAFRRGRHLRIKLADFGLAKCYEDAGFSQMTGERSVRGTLAYMAPEQFENSRDSGPSVDLFACGTCLYRLLLGKLPNVIGDPDETLTQLDQRDWVPDGLKSVLRKSIQADPADRYATAESFAAALHRFHRRG